MLLFPRTLRVLGPASYALRGTGDRPPPLAHSCTVKTGASAALSRGCTRMPPPAAKRVCGLKMPAVIKIGTHDGTFHCDEVLACFLLRQLPGYKDAEIVRTRDPALLSECDVVVDVGGEFDPKRHRYDHHQR
ncbi:MYG1 exonuclease-like [Polyodon spathula]|nr:MYG1 exonuclease-like [Polyodon spathula]